MLHARDDYNRIQDPAGLIPEDEPVFLVRAQDPVAIQTLEAYVAATKKLPTYDPDLVRLVEDHIARMAEWPTKKFSDV